MPRIKSLDLARGFTVLCIPAVHAVLLYSQPSVRETLFGQLLRFIAEGPGAQLFMAYMGISITLSKSVTWPAVLQRSILLLCAGYLLNIVKFVIPLKWGFLPAGLQTELGVYQACDAAGRLLLLGDILTFAAIALPITFFVYQLPTYGLFAIFAAVIVALISPWCWDHTTCSAIGNYLFNLAGGQPPTTFFPLFPWLVYPLAGLAIGELLSRDNPYNLDFIGLIGLFLFLLGHVAARFTIPSTSFYRTRPAETTFHMGIVLLMLWGWHFLARYVRPNYFFRILQYCSHDITAIYLIQWPLICWCLPIFGFEDLGYRATVLTATLMTGLTLFLSLLLNSLRLKSIVIED
jgi:Heparan-alpha-glucosaminide N-acetyltransferase, catalytic